VIPVDDFQRLKSLLDLASFYFISYARS